MLIVKCNDRALCEIPEYDLLEHAINFAGFHGVPTDHLRIWLENPLAYLPLLNRQITCLEADRSKPAYRVDLFLCYMIRSLASPTEDTAPYIASTYPAFQAALDQHIGRRITGLKLEPVTITTPTDHWTPETRIALANIQRHAPTAAAEAARADTSGRQIQDVAESASVVDDLTDLLLSHARSQINWQQIAAAIRAQP
jgi:hypothetical protein